MKTVLLLTTATAAVGFGAYMLSSTSMTVEGQRAELVEEQHEYYADEQLLVETETLYTVDTRLPATLDKEEKADIFELEYSHHETDWDHRDTVSVMGGIIGGVVKHGQATVATAETPSSGQFTFPDIVDNGAGEFVMIIADEPIPSRSDRRMLTVGDGPEVGLGDKIQVSYDMFSWANGELIESTRQFENQSLALTLGDQQVPNELQNALLNQTIGSRVQVVFEKNLSDLPDYMNEHDGYVLIVDIEDILL